MIAVGTAYAELLEVCTFVCVPVTAWLVFAVPVSSKHPYVVPARLTDLVTVPRYCVTAESHYVGAELTLGYSDRESPGRR